MNRTLLHDVVAPPIVAFKEKARRITPGCGRVFDMTQAVPAYSTFDSIRRRLKAALDDDQVSFYTDVPGLPELRTRIAATHPLTGSFTAENVLVTAGANHAMYTALTLLFNPGEKVLLLEPYYFNYDMAIRMLSLQPVYHPLAETDGFRLNAAAVIRHAEAAGVQGIIVITPNNPTGASYDAAELLQLLEWSSRSGVEILLDETYLRFAPRHLQDQRVGDFLSTTLTLIGSFSKSFSLTGYRVGYLIAAEQKMAEYLKVQDTMVICAPHLAQLAALHGLEACSGDVAAKVAGVARLEQVLTGKSAGLQQFRLASSGAYFAFLRHPFIDLGCEEATLSLYERTGILGLPGTVFGASMTPYIRLAFCNLTEAELLLALENLTLYDREMAA